MVLCSTLVNCLIWMCFTNKCALYRNNGIIHSRGSHIQTKKAYPSAPLDGKTMSFFVAHFLHYKLVILHNRMWIILLPRGLIFSFRADTSWGRSWGVILTVEDGVDRQRRRSRTNISGVNEGLRYKSNIDLILAPISELYIVQNNLQRLDHGRADRFTLWQMNKGRCNPAECQHALQLWRMEPRGACFIRKTMIVKWILI